MDRRRQRARSAARAADLPSAAGHVRARRRRAAVRRRRGASTSICCPASASPPLGHAHPGLARAIAEQAETLHRTRRTCSSSAAGRAGGAAGEALRAAARVLLQQRHRGGRGVPEVRAPLLVHAGRAAHRDRRARGLVPRPDLRRAVGHVGRALSRAVRAAAARLRFVPVNDPAALAAAVTDDTAAIIAEPIQGEGGVRPLTPAFAAAINDGVRRHRRAAHRRRSAERPRPDRLPVLLAGDRPAAASDLGRQGARRRRAGRRRAGQPSEVADDDRLRRPRHHLRRQPARLPRGALRSSTNWSTAA